MSQPWMNQAISTTYIFFAKSTCHFHQIDWNYNKKNSSVFLLLRDNFITHKINNREGIKLLIELLVELGLDSCLFNS